MENIRNNLNNVSKEVLEVIKQDNYEIKVFEELNFNNSYEENLPCQYDYNCMSFALNFLWDWLEPQNYRHVYDCDLKDYDLEEVEEVAKDCAIELEEQFGLRPIKNASDLKNGEYMIAFKVAADDFHFMRRFNNGQWYHKRGSWEIETIDEERVMAAEWEHRDTPYCSTTYFFAVPMFLIEGEVQKFYA